jgi:NifU-like protein involved in Fe-S cluster formation
MTAPGSRIGYYLERKPHAGALNAPDAVGGANVDGRPPEAVIYLRFHNGLIVEAGFQSSGCGYLVACCSALLDLCVGQTPAACAAIGSTQLEAHLGGLPEAKRYCAELAVLALANTLARVGAAVPRSEEAA